MAEDVVKDAKDVGSTFFGELRGGLSDFFSFKLLQSQSSADSATVAFLADQERRAEAKSASSPTAQAGLFPGIPANVQMIALGLGVVASVIAIARFFRE